jgi:isopenicillin-N N-acyltransferase-like protein
MPEHAVVHRSAPATPWERGLEFGSARRDAVGCTIAAYRRLFAATRGFEQADILAAGRRVRARAERDWPALADEVGGIAAGAGIEPDELFAVNARTELLAGQLRGECSTLASVGAARPVLMQNWDWHPDQAPARVVWVVELPEGGSFATLTEAGMLAKIGVNSHGIAICLNLLATSADGDLDGLPVHMALRLILATCTSIDEARSLLQNETFGASSCITVMDAAGDVAMFECMPGSPPLEPPVERGWASHTNHFLGALPQPVRDIMRADWPDTETRLGSVRAALAHAGDDPAAALRDHSDGPLSVCCHDEANPNWVERQATLASVRIWPRDRELEVAWGQPCVCDYQPITRLL